MCFSRLRELYYGGHSCERSATLLLALIKSPLPFQSGLGRWVYVVYDADLPLYLYLQRTEKGRQVSKKEEGLKNKANHNYSSFMMIMEI